MTSTVVPGAGADPSCGRVYDELYEYYLSLYTSTRETAHALAARQHADA